MTSIVMALDDSAFISRLEVRQWIEMFTDDDRRSR